VPLLCILRILFMYNAIIQYVREVWQKVSEENIFHSKRSQQRLMLRPYTTFPFVPKVVIRIAPILQMRLLMSLLPMNALSFLNRLTLLLQGYPIANVTVTVFSLIVRRAFFMYLHVSPNFAFYFAIFILILLPLFIAYFRNY